MWLLISAVWRDGTQCSDAGYVCHLLNRAVGRATLRKRGSTAMGTFSNAVNEVVNKGGQIWRAGVTPLTNRTLMCGGRGGQEVSTSKNRE